MLCINTKVIIPAMNIEDRIADAAEEIQTSKFFDTADIPSFCDYGVYSPTGAFQYGSLSEDTANTFWEKAATSGKNIIPPYRVRVIERVDDVGKSSFVPVAGSSKVNKNMLNNTASNPAAISNRNLDKMAFVLERNTKIFCISMHNY